MAPPAQAIGLLVFCDGLQAILQSGGEGGALGFFWVYFRAQALKPKDFVLMTDALCPQPSSLSP